LNIVPRTTGQRKYIQSIRNNKVTLCTGPAGTGKTIIATAMALKYVKEGIYNNIFIVRPTIVACNEKIGFLPGPIDDKMGPFVLPFMYSLNKLLKPDEYNQFVKKRVRIIPLAFMRGLTLDNCIIILDEAQNTLPEQMKMFLTRLGEHCKAIVEGDEDQTDIRSKNGLTDGIERFHNMEDIGIIEMDNRDILRSEFVARILDRYK